MLSLTVEGWDIFISTNYEDYSVRSAAKQLFKNPKSVGGSPNVVKLKIKQRVQTPYHQNDSSSSSSVQSPTFLIEAIEGEEFTPLDAPLSKNAEDSGPAAKKAEFTPVLDAPLSKNAEESGPAPKKANNRKT